MISLAVRVGFEPTSPLRGKGFQDLPDSHSLHLTQVHTELGLRLSSVEASKCGGGGIRTHASLTAQGFSKPSQWTNYATPPRFQGILYHFYLQIVRPQTSFTPAFLRVLQASLRVEPVVQTSSNNKILGY